VVEIFVDIINNNVSLYMVNSFATITNHVACFTVSTDFTYTVLTNSIYFRYKNGGCRAAIWMGKQIYTAKKMRTRAIDL